MPARQTRKRRRKRPRLRLSPYAWAKLRYLRDAGPTEIGGFGISSEDDPLLIEDIRLVQQSCDWASVSFDDESVADDFDRQVDLGIPPERFARVWVHTHPGASPLPSDVDEETFARVFGRCDWAVMMILAKQEATYARLHLGLGRFNSRRRVDLSLSVDVDFDAAFPASDQQAWQAEYDACVRLAQIPEVSSLPSSTDRDSLFAEAMLLEKAMQPEKGGEDDGGYY